MEKDCPNNPAMSKNFDTDFKAGASSVKGWKQTAGSLSYNSEGAQFTINKKGDAPTIQSEGYLHFGYVEVKCKAAPGQGVISSIVLQSEDLDEVDWEFIGGDNTNVQMNYFGKGNTTTYDRMLKQTVENTQALHTYALNWTSESITYIVDNKVARVLAYGDANGGKNYPQTPSTVRIGIWAGGDPDNEKGVIEWAGGVTDYTKAPFTMTVESVKVINYSPGTEYKWTDRTGSFESIEVIGAGDEDGAPVNSATIAPSATATGEGLASEINVPSGTATGTGAHGAPSKSCSEGEEAPSTTPSPAETPYPTGPSGGNGTVPAGPNTPCDCGIATVTVTGEAPPVVTPTTLVSSSSPLPVESSSAPVPPPVTVPVSSAPPYPSNPGIVTDTNPAPSVPIPTGGAIPPANATTSAPPEFTGAASGNKAGALVFVVAAAAMLAI
jgi:beta-glucanase (GH16 family)